jgi:SWIM/SEC-C metal-binding protein
LPCGISGRAALDAQGFASPGLAHRYQDQDQEEQALSKHKLGSEKRPIIARVHTDEQARYVAETCQAHGWHFIVGFEPDKPVDMSDLEQMLNPPVPITSTKVGRNDPCPCGSEKKYKKCCGSGALPA